MKKIRFSQSVSASNKSGGFTLIELLVVISIIALLVSILMPALSKAREQAKNVVGMSNLKQWGLVIHLYAQDNDGHLLNNATGVNREGLWVNSLRDYYEVPEIRLCPSASMKNENPSWVWDNSPYFIRYHGATHRAWRQEYPDGSMPDDGSYSINGWAQDPSGDFYREYYWRKTAVSNADEIPMFMDSMTPNLNPIIADGNMAPTFPEQMDHGWNNSIKRICVDRHGGAINMTFLDASVHKVGLKKLWSLRWHRGYSPRTIPDNAWPEWLLDMKDGVY